jgi:hypothetical protein
LLDVISKTSSKQRIGHYDLPLKVISHHLRKMGAPVSVTTGPLYLWQYLVDYHAYRLSIDEEKADPSVGFGLSDTPEHSSANYSVLLSFIANKHLMDMLTVASKTDELFIELLTSWKDATCNKDVEFDEEESEASIRKMVAALSSVLTKVAQDHSVDSKHHHHHHHHHHHRHRDADQSVVSLDLGQASSYWSRATSFNPMANDFVRSVFHEVRAHENVEKKSLITALQNKIYDILKSHAKAQENAQKISTSYRTKEAAEEMLMLKKEKESIKVEHNSWLIPQRHSSSDTVSSSSSSQSSDEDMYDSVQYEVDNNLQDRMCYFIIGNLHRLRAELKDRGLYDSLKPNGQTVSVATAVRALKVATACAYPPTELAKVLARASTMGRYSSYLSQTNNMWELPVDLSQLEVQIDKYLMTI